MNRQRILREIKPTAKACLLSVLLLASSFQSGVLGQQADFLSRLSVNSIAVLPPFGTNAPNAARTMSADLFASKFKLRSAATKIVTADEITSLLQSKAVMSDYSLFVTTLSQTGVVNTDALRKVAQATGADAVLLIDVLNYQEEKGSWWYGKGGKNVSRIQYTLFRSSDGNKIWETLEFRQHDSKVSTNPYPMEHVLGDVTDKAITALLAGTQHTDVRKKTE
jgi:hypothetical protein